MMLFGALEGRLRSGSALDELTQPIEVPDDDSPGALLANDPIGRHAFRLRGRMLARVLRTLV